MALVALLPWRAWAWATMAPAQALAPLHEVGMVTMVHDAAVPPCHAPALADHDATSPTEPPDHPAAQMCAHCDICHAGLAPPLHSLVLPTPDVPGYGPGLGPVRMPEHRRDALFKPPRLHTLTL